jgi:hypothetical protein
MSCIFLTNYVKVVVDEQKVDATSEPITRPRKINLPACKIGRPVDVETWAQRCRQTPPGGPCWLWLEEHGEESADPLFQQNLLSQVGY